MEIQIRENTSLNEIRNILDQMEPGYEALSSMAFKQPGQPDADVIRTSNIYQIEIGNQAAFEMKCRLDEVIKIVLNELLFVRNSTDRFLDGKREWGKPEVEQHLVNKAKKLGIIS